jgi:hypothetical protein
LYFSCLFVFSVIFLFSFPVLRFLVITAPFFSCIFFLFLVVFSCISLSFLVFSL